MLKYEDMDKDMQRFYYPIVREFEDGQLDHTIRKLDDLHEFIEVICYNIKTSYDINCVPPLVIRLLESTQKSMDGLIIDLNRLLVHVVDDIKTGNNLIDQVRIKDDVITGLQSIITNKTNCPTDEL